MLNLDALSLANCHIGTDGIAESVMVSPVLANIRDTVVKVGCWVNGVMALPEWSILSGQDPTVLVTLVSLCLCFITCCAIACAAIHTTRSLFYLPAFSKLDSTGSLMPILHY